MDMYSDKITVSELAKQIGLISLTDKINLDEHFITLPDINRPSLQLTGFWDCFEPNRVQIVGNVEYMYLQKLTPEDRFHAYEEFFSQPIPCVVFARSLRPEEAIIELAYKKNIPLLSSSFPTSAISAEVIRWLHVRLAPMVSVHGVLMDVYGEGVLITGESGIGKSEAAIELIKRGHRLVSDDVVEIRRVSDQSLVGSSPEMTKYLIEVRGIGIIDVKTLFGVGAVKDTQNIDVVIQLEEWTKTTSYDRMGMEEQYIQYLGKDVPCYKLPVRPGRNLAVIVEVAAMNHRQQQMGYNAAKDLWDRVSAGKVEEK